LQIGLYSIGYNCQNRVEGKQDYYTALVVALRNIGWSVRAADDVSCAPSAGATGTKPFVFFLGTTGEVYNSTLNSLKAFDIDKARLKPLLQELHVLSIKHTTSILATRRAMDATAARGHAGAPALAAHPAAPHNATATHPAPRHSAPHHPAPRTAPINTPTRNTHTSAHSTPPKTGEG